MTAQLDVLCAGYAADRVASTVVLIRDEGAVIVVDPGMVAGRRRILDPLARLGVDPAVVTDVVLSHHHPDHTLNAALFERARVHDFWAIYQGDTWTDRPADGFALSPSVRLMATPGHTAQDITTLADTDDGLAAVRHQRVQFLCEQQRRRHVALHVAGQQGRRKGVRLVVFEQRSVVDDAIQCAQQMHGLARQGAPKRASSVDANTGFERAPSHRTTRVRPNTFFLANWPCVTWRQEAPWVPASTSGPSTRPASCGCWSRPPPWSIRAPTRASG